MQRRTYSSRQRALVLAGLTSALLFVASSLSGASHDPTPPAVPTPQPGEVTNASQIVEPTAVVRDGIPISAQPQNAPRVVYSVRIPPLNRAEGFYARAEAHVSKCNQTDTVAGGGPGAGDAGSPCQLLNNNEAYNYAPHVGAKVVVGSSASDTVGFASSTRTVRDCTEQKHHCPVDASAGFLIPASGATRYVNLVVDANHPNRRPNDVVELEADCLPNSQGFEDYSNCHPPDPSVELTGGSHGKLNVIRFGEGRGGDQAAIRDATEQVNQIPDGQKRVVYSVAVNVDAGDVIDVDADLKTSPAGAAGNPLVNAAVIMADSSTDTSGNHVSAWNGFNCNNLNTNPCTSNKHGAATLGAGGTRYVNLVARPTRDNIDVHTGAGGFLDVIARPRFSP
jgi:hypothetical protein